MKVLNRNLSRGYQTEMNKPIALRIIDSFSFHEILQRFPETELIRCQTKEIVESHFMSCLKEVNAIITYSLSLFHDINSS